MQALQKQKKSEFKTIEGVISRMKKGTDEIESSMSSKCADIDKVTGLPIKYMSILFAFTCNIFNHIVVPYSYT